MEINKEKIRYILQYHYDKGKNAAQTCEQICAIYGEDILSKSAARKWFAHFRAENFDVKDEPRSGRPIFNSLNGVKLTLKEACENHLKQFFDQKSQKFYRDGIMILPQKWQNIIENNGAYLV
ncbi:hypothetical protein ALC53_12827 [Atta colombica]|uniref:Mos1 transposase HTH domain-containing protein n=1 Tax=Atta colombica TaxID=520822 RepID=A0A151HZ16_9HYME|nr:hypothetical protein ALC53_12827 [Atta colombica]